MNIHPAKPPSGDLRDVLKPVDQARGLPNGHYVDPLVFAEERDAVLFANWSGIGFGKDVPSHGDAMPVDFLGMPLVAVRDKDGSINVFQNTCRHRGMILVKEKGKVRGTMRCPYHSWCYALDGRLVTKPHVGGPGHNTHEEIRRDELGLLRIRSHVWRDVIFVNISSFIKFVCAKTNQITHKLYHLIKSSFAKTLALNGPCGYNSINIFNTYKWGNYVDTHTWIKNYTHLHTSKKNDFKLKRIIKNDDINRIYPETF